MPALTGQNGVATEAKSRVANKETRAEVTDLEKHDSAPGTRHTVTTKKTQGLLGRRKENKY